MLAIKGELRVGGMPKQGKKGGQRVHKSGVKKVVTWSGVHGWVLALACL